jgi:hypothetical protein
MRQPAVVVAGEPELHGWCATCRLPSRVRVPLHIGSTTAPVSAVLEICPGCGTGHDRPLVAAISPGPRPPVRFNPFVRAAHALHRLACRRSGLRSLGCAHRDCPWPGQYRHEHQMAGEDGTWRYYFCTRRHRRTWAAEHRIRLT